MENIFRVLKEKKSHQPRILYSVKLSLKNEGIKKIEKSQIREFAACRPASPDFLKKFLGLKVNDHRWQSESTWKNEEFWQR